MIREIVQRARHSVAREISGARAIDHAKAPERPRDETRVLHGAHPHHAIEAFADQVDFAIGATQLEFEQRVLAEKLRQMGDHEVACSAARHVHPQAAA